MTREEMIAELTRLIPCSAGQDIYLRDADDQKLAVTIERLQRFEKQYLEDVRRFGRVHSTGIGFRDADPE